MGAVFINYRGDDSQTAGALIDRELAARFGSAQVFLDSRSIPAGADFVDELLSQLRACAVLLVVIGPHWLALTNETGQRRIDHPHDWIRREIAEALSHGLRVIPILTDGATLPTETDLPADIAGLSRRQYLPLRHRYTGIDLAYLIDRLIADDPALAEAAARHQPTLRPVPRQLPGSPRLFTGRLRDLDHLTAMLDDPGRTVVVCAIGGAGGIGKTWLALHWAHQHLDRFPDGHLFVNLNGFAPTAAPVTPARAVRGFLDALGVDPSGIPVEFDAQVALYRSLVAGRRMLVVLDNARDTDQVVPLLPGSPTCTVIVTSRSRLTGLVNAHGARPLPVDVLSDYEAHELLVARLGTERLAAEPDAVAELLSCCAGFPLALSIVAGRAETHPGFPLVDLTVELHEATTRLDALADNDPAASLPAVLSWSYIALPAEQAKVFGLLGIAPGPDISLPAAANLTNLPISRTRAMLRALEQAHLVQQHAPGRYRMHDLIKLYASDRAHYDLPDTERTDGLRRLVDFSLHTAHAAERLLNPHRPPIELDPTAPGVRPHPLPDQAAAWEWLAAEHPCLLATQHLAIDQGWHRAVWQLTWTLDTFRQRRGHLHDRLLAWQVGLVAAQHEDDPTILSRAHRTLADACAFVSRHVDALDHLGHALHLAQRTGDFLAQAHIYNVLTWAWTRQGQDRCALEHATSALHLFQALDQPVWEAAMLNSVGWLSAQLGNYQQADTHCQAALALCRRYHDRAGEANTLDSLGYIAHHTGQHHQALNYYQQALVLIRDLGDTYEQAGTLDHLGQAHAALAEHDQARHVWQQALLLCRAQHRAEDVERIQQQLDALNMAGQRA